MVMVEIVYKVIKNVIEKMTPSDWHMRLLENQNREVGALGFEPRSAGFHHAGSDPTRINGSSLQLFITGQLTR